MPVSVFEVTMATPNEVCVEVRDAPITHGQIFDNAGVSIAATSPQAFPILNISQSPADGSFRITSSGNPFAAFYWDVTQGGSGIVGITSVQGIPGFNGTWNSQKIDDNTIDLLTTVYAPGWVTGTGKVWDYFNWTTYAPAGRRGWLAGTNQDFFRSCDLEPSAFFNRAAANVPANWAPFGGVSVTAVYMKSKNYDRGYVDGVVLGQFTLTSALKHFVHLKLSGPLPQGGPYTIANANAGISTSFTFNDRTTRAIAIHVSGAGHRPNDATKLGYLSLWRPGAPNEGAVDFSAFTQFEIIDSTNATVAGPLPIALRIGATEPEERIGLDPDNILGGYSDTKGATAYNSTDPTKIINITALTVATDPEFTTASNHGYAVGTKLRLIDMGGDGRGPTPLTNLTIKVTAISAPNKFTAVTFSDAGAWDRSLMTDTPPPVGFGPDPYANWIAAGRTGKVCRLHESNRAGTNVYGLDYSGFAPGTEGNYRLRIIGLGCSDPITFSFTAWRQIARVMAHGEYHHRWGIALDGRFGTTRPKNFIDGVSKLGNQNKIYQSKMPYPFGWGSPLFGVVQGFTESTAMRPEWFFPTATPGQFHQSRYGLGAGSWADAGDWVTRVSGIVGACYSFCELSLLRPSHASSTAFNIPKSAALFPDVPEYVGTDDMPDMVHQAIFGVECYRRMQYGPGDILPEGSVPSGLIMDTSTGTAATPSNLTPSVNAANAPDQMSNYYYAFAAAKIAQLCYAYNHSAAGDLWKNSAIKAWSWAELIFSNVTERENYYNGVLGIEAKAANQNYIAGGKPTWDHPTYIANRETLNNDANSGTARCNAAATLFRLTGGADYKAAVELGLNYINNNPNVISFDPLAGKQMAAWEYAQTPGVDATARSVIRNTFLGSVTRFEAGVEHFSGPVKTPCRTLMNADDSLFNLGAQGTDLSNKAWPLIVMHLVNGDARSLKTMQDGMGFIFGANMLSMSSVAQVGNRWPGTIFNADQLFNGVECAQGIGCYFYSFLGQWSFSFGTWGNASNAGCIESPDPRYTAEHIFEREVIPGRYATPVYEAVWESHYSLNLMERSIQQDVLPLQQVAFYLDAWDEVQGIASATALTSSENPTFVGSSITFTATVTGSGATPTGAVTFRDGGSSVGSGNLNASGVATFVTSALQVGVHSITAVYGGDATYAGSSSPPVTESVLSIAIAAFKTSPPVFGVH